MKTSRYSDSQILAILKQAVSGTPVPALCCEHGMSNASSYKWRENSGAMDASMMKRMKELEDENRRLKKMYADGRLKAETVQEALAKSGDAISTQRNGREGGVSTRPQRSFGLPCFRHQRDLLPLPADSVGQKRRNCRLADYQPTD